MITRCKYCGSSWLLNELIKPQEGEKKTIIKHFCRKTLFHCFGCCLFCRVSWFRFWRGWGEFNTSCDTCPFCIPAGLCLGYFCLVNFWAFSQRCLPLSWLTVTELLMMEGTEGEEFCWNHLSRRQFISPSCPSAFNIHTKLIFKDLNKWADTSGVGFYGRLSHWRTVACGAFFMDFISHLIPMH